MMCKSLIKSVNRTVNSHQALVLIVEAEKNKETLSFRVITITVKYSECQRNWIINASAV